MAVYLVSFTERQKLRWGQIRVSSVLAAILGAAAIMQSLIFSVSYTNTAGSRLGDFWSADNDDSFMGGSALYIPDNMDEQPLQSDETIIFPLVYYKGYCVRCFTETGELLRTVKPQNTDGCVTVNLQRGFTGSTWIFFREPWYWRMAEIFSLGLAGTLIVWRNGLVVVHSILM